MFIADALFGRASSVGSRENFREKDPENSTLLKIATCIPVLGMFIGAMPTESLKRKLKELPLPHEVRRFKEDGNILDETATPEEKKAACERAIQLMSIQRDYIKADLVNNILTVALAVYALATHAIPLFVAGILIVGMSISAAAFALCLYFDSIQYYEKKSAGFASQIPPRTVD